MLQAQVYTGLQCLLLELRDGHCLALLRGGLLLQLGDGGLEVALALLQGLDLLAQLAHRLAGGVEFQTLLGGQGLHAGGFLLVTSQVADEALHELLAVLAGEGGLLLVGEEGLALVVLGECLDAENCQHQAHDFLQFHNFTNN